MKRHRLIVGTLLIAGAYAAVASAQVPTRSWSLSVRVNSTKPDGAAWDALGGAPDIGACTASARGTGCAMVEGTTARCQDQFSCDFTLALPETFTVSFWDLDLAADDLIGTCYIDHPGTYTCGSATVTAR